MIFFFFRLLEIFQFLYLESEFWLSLSEGLKLSPIGWQWQFFGFELLCHLNDSFLKLFLFLPEFLVDDVELLLEFFRSFLLLIDNFGLEF